MKGKEPRPSISDLIIEEIRRREEQEWQEKEERKREQPTVEQPTVEIYIDPGSRPKPKDGPDEDRGVTEIHFFDKGK